MKFKDLEIGMITGDGLITDLIEAGTVDYWGDKCAVTYICLQDPYMGQCSRAFDEDYDGDFEELYPVGSPEYEKAIQRMIEDRLRASFDALEDVKLMRAYKKSSERIKG